MLPEAATCSHILMMPQKKVLSIRVEDSMYKRICDYAGKHKMTVTEVVLQGLERILNRPE